MLPISEASPSSPHFREAYERLLDDIRAVPAANLVSLNIDILKAVTKVLGSLPKISALRSRAVAELSQFDVGCFDKLEGYTMALFHVHGHLRGTSKRDSLEPLLQAAAATRATLLSDVSALVQRNLVDGRRLKHLKGPKGFRNLAFDLFELGIVLRDSWPAISGKTALDLDQIAQAEILGDQLLTMGAMHQKETAIFKEVTNDRLRAFSLFVSTYDQVRRAVIFLRWNEGDADRIAPSLYAGRGGRKHKRHGDLQSAATTDAPTTAPPLITSP